MCHSTIRNLAWCLSVLPLLVLIGCQQDDSAPVTTGVSTDVEVAPQTDEQNVSAAIPEPTTPVIASQDTSSPTVSEDPTSLAGADQKLEESPATPGSEIVVSPAATPESSEAVENSSDESSGVAGLINLDEERKRQQRLIKLGLGKSDEPAEPRPIKLLVENREFQKDESHAALRMTYDDLDLLKILNMEPVPLDAEKYLPSWLTELEGKEVVIRGWMYPTDRATGLKGFIFVRDNQVCCFGPNAKAYDKMTVRLKKGSTVDYVQGRPIDVVGTFHIESWIEDERDLRTGEFIEKLNMLYHLEDAVVVGE